MDRARIYRLVFAAVGAFSLGLQYVLAMQASELGLGRLTLTFLSYFTVQTNIFILLAMAGPALAPGGWGQGFAREGYRAAVTMYAVIVWLVYHFLLHRLWDPQGWLLVVNVLLHYVMPLAMLADWVMFTPKGRLRWRHAFQWLAVPALYEVWTLIHGFATDWWPYWFVNVPRLGWPKAIGLFLGLLVFFTLIGLVLVALDRRLGRRDRTAAAA